MAATPYFHCPPHSSAGAHDSDVAGFGSGAPDATAAAMVSQEHSVTARPRMRRSSSGSGKQQPGGGAKKPPQRGLGVAELERLRCGGDPLRELGFGVVGSDAGAQLHPLLHCNHHHHHVPASAFDAVNARYCSSLPVQPPPQPAVPGCYVHHPPAAGGPRAPSLAPGQQCFMDRSGRMGGFTPASNGFNASGDHQSPLPPAPEHPSSQSTIWRPAASSSSSSSSCLQSGHRCGLCARRMMRPFAERRGTSPPAAPPSLTATTMPDYSIYDLAAAMATARQGEAAFLAQDRKPEALNADAPAKKEVREIQFFPATTTHHSGGGGVLDESEFVAPISSSYGTASYAAAPAALDLSLRL